jgi:sigma-B regulation protein RsbU (phosphoserine phosphatase)
MQTIRDLISKYRKKLIVPSAIFLGLLLLIQLYFVLVVTPQPNDECIWDTPRAKYGDLTITFKEVKFEGVTWNAGIRDGDLLLEINGEKIDNVNDANRVLNSLSIGDSANYRINRDGLIFDAKVEIKKLILISNLSAFLVSLIWIIVGFIVISSKPDGLSQILFFRIGATLVFSACIILLQSENIFNPISNYPSMVILADTIQTFGTAFLPSLLVHFFWIFPRKLRVIDKKYTTKILYLLPLTIFVLATVFKVLFVYGNMSAINFFYPYFRTFTSGLLAIGVLVGLVSLFVNYLKITSRLERTAIFIILIAYVIGILSVVYFVILSSSVDTSTFYNSPELFSPIILIALLPIAFGFSIFRYSLMDVSDVLKNTLLYGSATVSLAAVYFLIIYILGQSVSSAIGTEYQGIIAGLIFIVFAIIFQSTKDKFQEIITEKFYPEQFAYQKVVLKFINEVNTIAGLENILTSTCQTFIEALKVDRFGILLKDKNSNSIYNLEAQHGFIDSRKKYEVDIAALAKYILAKKDSNLLLVIEDNEFESLFPNDHNTLSRENIYTIIPLFIRSRVIGFLLFGLKRSGSKFAGKDLELLSSAANQTAVAIENARLYQSEAEKMKMDRDLENARHIQMSLLPSKYPKIKGLDVCGKMIPAMHVGGDYYDLIKVSETKMFAVIGDVSGKGLSASFYMSKLQTMIQLFCDGTNSPKEILMELNNRIFKSIEKNWFITVSIALIDTHSEKITYARAGHTPMLITRDGKTREFTPKGIGIGLESGEIFNRVIEEVEIPLNHNSTITLFSDGIPELMNKDRQQYGTQKFISLLESSNSNSCNQTMQEILSDLDNHNNLPDQNDDITLILLKYAS